MTKAAGAGAGMFYGMAVKQGVNALASVVGTTAEEAAAYNESYARHSARYAAQSSLSAAQKNISKVKQNKILSHVQLQQQQDQAEAAAKVAAAHAGVEGSSVNAVIQQTEVNESLGYRRIESHADGAIDQFLAQAHAARLGMASTERSSSSNNFESVVGNLLGSFNEVDLQNVGTWIEQKDWLGDETMDYNDGSGLSFGEEQA